MGAVAGFVVITAVAAIVAVKISSSKGPAGNPSGASDADVVHAASTVPLAVLDQVGLGSDLSAQVSPPMKILSGSRPLTLAGKPEILYEGAEFCPYCAAQRWAIVVALSEVGRFSNLRTISSKSSPEVYPDTPTFTFYKSTYESPYVSFVAVEEETRSETPLQSPTPEESKLFSEYEKSPYLQKGEIPGIPFVDLGNRYLIIGPSYSPGYLHSASGDTAPPLPIGTVAGGLSMASTSIAKVVDGTANYILGGICWMTNNRPVKVCASAGPRQAEAVLAAERSP